MLSGAQVEQRWTGVVGDSSPRFLLVYTESAYTPGVDGGSPAGGFRRRTLFRLMAPPSSNSSRPLPRGVPVP